MPFEPSNKIGSATIGSINTAQRNVPSPGDGRHGESNSHHVTSTQKGKKEKKRMERGGGGDRGEMESEKGDIKAGNRV